MLRSPAIGRMRSWRSTRKSSPAIFLALLFGTAATPVLGDGWSGSFGIGYYDLDHSGSLASFQTQTGLDEGFVLDELELRFADAENRRPRFTLSARGFGDAEPTRRARVRWNPDSPWHLSIDYDRRESFFALAETELGLRNDAWQLTRWRGGITWEGWSAADLGLSLRFQERDGTIRRPLFGLNQLYPLRVDIDESMSEAALRLETRTLPVKISFEQAAARYERQNRQSADGEEALEDFGNLFLGSTTTRRDDTDVSTSRLTVSYPGSRVEIAATALYRPADLEASGLTGNTFALDGGAVGTVEFVEDILGSGELDAVSSRLEIGVRLTESWGLRIHADYRDTSTSTELLGTSLARVTNVFGQTFELSGLIDDGSFLDLTEDGTRAELEWRRGDWSAWAGAFRSSRDASWRVGSADPQSSVERESNGSLAGIAYRPGSRVKIKAEYEHGSFDNFIFRTHPETVDRLTVHADFDLGNGWTLGAQGRFDEAENPLEIANLDRSSEAVAARLGWSSRDGETGFGSDLNHTDFTSETALVLPGQGSGLSIYDLSLLTASVHGRIALGRFRLGASATQLEDSGGTYPIEALTARARVAMEVAERTSVSLFVEHWSYDEDLGSLDDYDVTRVGLGLRWEFE